MDGWLPAESKGEADLRKARHRQGPRPRRRGVLSELVAKTPNIVTRESAAAVRSNLLEIADGEDIVETTASFARRRQRGVCVLSGSGAVSSASLRQPGEPGSVIELSGPLEILSLSGAFMPPPSPPDAMGLKALLAGGQGQVVGGKVVGALRASGHVTISYDDLSLEHGVDDPGKVPAAVTGVVLPFA